MRRTWCRAILVTFAVISLLLVTFLLWPTGSAEWTPPLSILVGMKEYEIREPLALRSGKARKSRMHINRVHMPKEHVMAMVRKELASKRWYISSGLESGNTYMEAPMGFMEVDRMTMGARKNKVDPETQAVLGNAADSRAWTTITVSEPISERNVLVAVWRWARRLTGP